MIQKADEEIERLKHQILSVPLDDQLCIVDESHQDGSINKETNFSLSNKLNHFDKTLTARLNTEDNRLFISNFKAKYEEQHLICQCDAGRDT